MSLLTTAEVATELAMSEEWVRDHAAELGAIRAGGPRAPLRFEPAAIEAWKERQRLEPAEIRISHQRSRPPRTPAGVDLLPLP